MIIGWDEMDEHQNEWRHSRIDAETLEWLTLQAHISTRNKRMAAMRHAGAKIKDIASEFGVSAGYAGQKLAGLNWRYFQAKLARKRGLAEAMQEGMERGQVLTPITELAINPKTRYPLWGAGWRFVEDIEAASDQEISAAAGVGWVRVEEVRSAIIAYRDEEKAASPPRADR